jgi:uncharacterized membrane protein
VFHTHRRYRHTTGYQEVTMKITRTLMALLVAGVVLAMGVPAASAQETATTTIPTHLTLTTPYVGVSVGPGNQATFTVDVAGPPGSKVDLELDGLPEGWYARLQGGGFELNRVQLGETGHVSIDLNVTVPEQEENGRAELTLTGVSGSTRATLDLSIVVAAAAGGEVGLTTDFPALQGPSDSTYSFNLQLDNGTPQEIQFGLSAEGPAGWQVDIQPSGEAKASTVTVGGGSSSTVTVNVDPPDTVEAGTYTITAGADGGGQSASVDLTIDITGTFDLELTTASQVLNLDVNAGQPTDLDLILVNTGTAPLQGVSLTATPPSGWDVTFSPSALDVVAPGESVPVTATLTPSEDAINGDYVVTLNAAIPEAQASTEIRATVKTSAAWGLVGVAVIVLALVGLAAVFRHYGRR